MRIGFLSHTLPLKLESSTSGVYQRMGMFVEALKGFGRLDMLFFVPCEVKTSPAFVAEMQNRLSNYWDADISLHLITMAKIESSGGSWHDYVRPALSIRSQVPYSYTTQQKQLAAVNHLLARKPDILFCHRLRCMIPVLLTRQKARRIYFDMDDIEHVALQRSIKQPPHWRGKPLQYMQLPVLRFWERRAVKTSYSTFVCSQQDRDYLSRIFHAPNVTMIPNAVNIPPLILEDERTDETSIMFVGHLAYPPNTVAVDFLIDKVWPLVLSALPKARLLIAGADPERLSSYHKKPPGVRFLGFVADLGTLYRQVRLVVCPILSGGGTRIKILEAAAYGKPIVSTTVGAEGIELQNGKEIILRDEPGSFAHACVSLLLDNNLRRNVGFAARSVVAFKYCRDEIVMQIRRHIEDSTSDLQDDREPSVPKLPDKDQVFA